MCITDLSRAYSTTELQPLALPEPVLCGGLVGLQVICAPFMGKARWVIGWAMVGRAEFACGTRLEAMIVTCNGRCLGRYLIAQMALSAGMLDPGHLGLARGALQKSQGICSALFYLRSDGRLHDMQLQRLPWPLLQSQVCVLQV